MVSQTYSRRRLSIARSGEGDGRQRRHRPDYRIVLIVGILMLIGLVVMYAIGPQRANALNMPDSSTFFVKQFWSVLASIVFFAAISFVSVEFIRKHSYTGLWIGFLLCILLYLVGNVFHIDQLAQNTLGAYRWFNFGPIGTIQPSEVLKFTLLIYTAVFLGKRFREGEINNVRETILPITGVLGAALFIVAYLQKDMGTSIAIFAVVISMLIVSTVSWRIIGVILGVSLVAGVLLILIAPHRRERILTFLSSNSSNLVEDDEDGRDYHIKNAMIALGSGGLLGRGIGQSVQASGYLPEAVNDSIFAILGEIFGFLGTTFVVILFGALLIRILKVSDHLEDMSLRLMVAGVFGWLAAHVIMNIASMIGLLPLTGITLPLVSSGGTSMVFIAGALGLVFHLSRYTSHQAINLSEVKNENSNSRRRVGRTRYSRSGSH